LIRHLGIHEDRIRIHNCQGVDRISQQLAAILATPGHQGFKGIGLVRDADADAQAALQGMQSALEKVGLPVPTAPEQCVPGPPAVNILILPGTGQPGMLETLLWQRNQ